MTSPAACHPGEPEGATLRQGDATVALVGPPNAGKTTLFNRLTGLRQKVANYPGVTVEKHLGEVRLSGGTSIDLIDLPGIHGFSGRSLDERVAMDVLSGRITGETRPDAVILIADSTRLETHLLLVEPILELGVPTLLVLNMADELAQGGGTIEEGVLAERWGIRVARTSARRGTGIDAVMRFLADVAAGTASAPPAPPPEAVLTGIADYRPLPAPAKGDGTQALRVSLPTLPALVERRHRVRRLLAEAKYTAPRPSGIADRIDTILLHPVWGSLVFGVVVLLVFQAIFTWAVPLMDAVDALVGVTGGWLQDALPPSWFRSLLVDGIWAGVGSVVIFLPQILILFLFLGVLEDSGYLARGAVIADRLMQPFGLQGRSFLPLLSGYACAIPAILAARTVEGERDRLATIFVTPFMTCSARLPVYALLIAAFIPNRPVLGPFLGARALTLLGLYLLGTVTALATVFVLRRTLLRGPTGGFVIELPPYRVPSARSLGLRLYDRATIFLRRAGTVILSVTVVLWVLTQFPRVDGAAPSIETSALGAMGRVIEPAIEPLGFDWRIGVGLVSSLAAREVIVGTLGTIYGVEGADEAAPELLQRLQESLDLGAAVGLLVFFAFALQCMSTVAVVRRETGGWRWPALQFGYMLFLAWVGAWFANLLL